MRQLLSDRAALAHQALISCRLCSRDCGVNRLQSRSGAFCRLDEKAWIYKELLSVGEEAVLNPTWLVDVGGCSLRCLYCSEWSQVVQPRGGPAVELEPQWFAGRMAKRQAQGARTLTLVGGEPTVNLPALLQALACCPAPCRWCGTAMAWSAPKLARCCTGWSPCGRSTPSLAILPARSAFLAGPPT